ncbi:hypothetical protein HYU17_03205 [Candidatus Woesearchaeota archaeon]|nr:hypothetical protein [Candidatus Woesearchaeota archaeon]
MKWSKQAQKLLVLSLVLLVALVLLDRLQPRLTTTPLSGYAVYETRQLTWDFDDESDYTYDSSLVDISGGEAKLKPITTTAEISDSQQLKLPKGNSSELAITGISDSEYATAELNAGDSYYGDKNYKITAIPAGLQGMLWLKTEQDDHDSKKNVSFTTNKPIKVFVGYDKRKETAPDWLQSWAYWGEGITTDDDKATPFKLYYKDFAAGNILLGSNNKAKAMYVVLLNNTAYSSSAIYTSSAISYEGKPKTIAFAAENPAGTTVKLQIRTAEAQDGLESAQWLGPTSTGDYYTAPGEPINSAHSKGGWLQYKAVLETVDAAGTPTLSGVTIAAEKSAYAESATVTTNNYNFEKSVEVQSITADEEPNGQTVSYAYSTDSGSSWTATSPGESISVKTGKLAVKAVLSSNTTHTPAVKAIIASYKTSVCDENWQAAYTSCSKNDEKRKYYRDANACGSTEDLPADNGTTEGCNYCSPEWANANSSCRNDDRIAVSYFYTNDCCSETGLQSDCTIPQNTTATCDYCTPLWTETNSSCGKDDKIAAAYNDANNCYAATGLASDNNKPNSRAYGCDYCKQSYSCISYGECSEGNTKECILANDSNSCYAQTGLATDSYSGDYSEFQAGCTYDNEIPVVNGAAAAIENGILTITANVTDKSSTTVTAMIVRDGMALMSIALANTTKETYAGTANAAELKGAYLIAIAARDRYNNTAKARGAAGITVGADKSAAADVSVNSTRKALLKLTNTTTAELTGKAGEGAAGKLILAEHRKDPKNSTKPSLKKELRRYVEIEADEDLKSNISLATLRINYSEEETSAANVSEESLAMYFYNETASLWEELNSTANIAQNYVEGNTTHLSLFGIFGNETVNLTINLTINETNLTANITNLTTNATINQTTNATNTTANATTNETTNATGSQNAQQQAQAETAAAEGGGGAGGNAAKPEENKTGEKAEATAETAEGASEGCSYDLSVGMEGKPSLINKTEINATLTNTGTCLLQGIEIKTAPPIDSYITVENSKVAELKPSESFRFAIRTKTASPQYNQPVQGFAVKEQRKISVHNGKILITGRGVKGMGLETNGMEGSELLKEIQLNIEVYEPEQKSGKNQLASLLLGTLTLAGLLGVGYSMIKRNLFAHSGSQKALPKNEPQENHEAHHEHKHEPISHTPLETEAAGFEENLKLFEEKWKKQQDDEQQQKESGGSPDAKDEGNSEGNMKD